jgi:hypothetical protein
MLRAKKEGKLGVVVGTQGPACWTTSSGGSNSASARAVPEAELLKLRQLDSEKPLQLSSEP